MPYRDRTPPANDWIARATPPLVLALLIPLAVLPTPFDQRPLPDLVLTGVYIACVRRPEAVPILALFVLGLLQDLLGNVPLGLHALSYVLVHGVATRLPLARHGLLHLWLGFVPVAIMAGAAGWLAMCAYHTVWIGPDPVLARAAASIILFPVLAIPLVWLLGRPRHAA